jgi:hypothetical protein
MTFQFIFQLPTWKKTLFLCKFQVTRFISIGIISYTSLELLVLENELVVFVVEHEKVRRPKHQHYEFKDG